MILYMLLAVFLSEGPLVNCCICLCIWLNRHRLQWGFVKLLLELQYLPLSISTTSLSVLKLLHVFAVDALDMPK